MSNEGGRKANLKCFIELVLIVVKWGSVLLGPLRTPLKEWKRGSFSGSWLQLSRIDSGVLTPQISMCKHMLKWLSQ
mgnify:CR=1 FL=1